MITKEKEMKISQTYRADSASQEPKSALRKLMQPLGLTFLACTLAVGATEARPALRSALKVVIPAQTKGAASSDLSSSGMRASARASAIITSA